MLSGIKSIIKLNNKNMTELQNQTVLVTGGAGFIGSHLCEKLLSLGAKVVCMDNLFTGKEENMSTFANHENFKYVQADANNKKELREVFENNKLDYVFHYAAILGVKRVIEQPLLVLEDLIGIEEILKLSKEFGIKKVLFSSSSEAYGFSTNLPLREDDGHEFENNQNDHVHMYALVKLMGEKIMRVYNDRYGVPTCSLRFFNVFGPRQESSAYGFVAGVFIEQVIKNQAPTVFGDGFQTRDFIYVRDNVDLAIKAMIKPETNGQVINIGVGRQTTIVDLAERVIKISGKDLKPKFVEGRVEIKYRSPDTTKMHKLLESKIEDRLDENLKITYESYLKRYGQQN